MFERKTGVQVQNRVVVGRRRVKTTVAAQVRFLIVNGTTEIVVAVAGGRQSHVRGGHIALRPSEKHEIGHLGIFRVALGLQRA